MSESETQAVLEFKQIRARRLSEHRERNKNELGCSGLTDKEWLRSSTKQKQSFRKSKKFAYTRLWNHNKVKL